MAAVDTLDGAWVAVQVRPNHERIVASQLEVHGYDPYVPTYARATSRVRKNAASPLFPGYVFCRYVRHPSFRIVQTAGVIRILNHGNVPAVLSDDEIETIRLMSREACIEPWRFLQIGQRVRIQSGPLRGLEGVLVEMANRLRMVVSIILLRRSVAVTVDAEQLTLLPDHA